MKIKAVSGIMVALLLTSMLTLAFKTQPAKASGTIYIRADGSIEGTTHISTVDNVTYTFTGNIYDSIVVERDDIVVDGACYTVQGTGLTPEETGLAWQNLTGIYLAGRRNVTIKNVQVKAFYKGIVLYESSNNSIYGNSITNNVLGIYVRRHPLASTCSQNNTISRNTITNNDAGIEISSSSYNEVSNNKITNNFEGLRVGYWSSGNTIFGNIINNNGYGIKLEGESFSNSIFHNSFIDNADQVHVAGELSNVWDKGYPSGGNYWSDYMDRYPDAEETDDSGIWNTPYEIDKDNQDNYPLMSPWILPPLEHELVTSITAPAFLRPGSSLSLNATVTNEGLNDEVDMELLLLINGTIVDSTTIPILQAGESYTLSYLWTPTVEGTYNVTAHVPQLPEEEIKVNNQNIKFITVVQSVNAGDWIKYAYSYEESPETPYIEWIKVEFLNVEQTHTTVRLTMYMSNGTEGSETLTLDIARTLVYSTGGTFDTYFGFGFVIPANSTVEGDYVYIILLSPKFMLGKKIDGETTRTYAGASRTVVYATFSSIGGRYGNKPLKYYWDKQTGVMVEASATLDGMTATAKATETNIWEAVSTAFWMQWWFFAIVAVVIVALAGVVYFLKKRKPPTPTAPALPSEGTETSARAVYVSERLPNEPTVDLR